MTTSTSGKADKPLRRPSLTVPRFNQIAMDDWCPASRREKEAGHRWKLMYLMAEHSKAAYEVRKFEELCGRIAMIAVVAAVSLEVLEGHGVFADVSSQVVHCWELTLVAAMLSAIQVAEIGVTRGMAAGGFLATRFTSNMLDSFQQVQQRRAKRQNDLDRLVDASIEYAYVPAIYPRTGPPRARRGDH